jgi:chromosome segregation ATPase
LVCYEDHEGVLVIDDSVPPDLVHKGYTVLNANGRVLRTIARQLTEEELSDPDNAMLKERIAEEQRLRAREYDRALLRRYSTVEDVEASRRRKVNEVKVRIHILRGNISGMRTQLEGYQGTAATLEREGQPVPEGLLDNIRILREEIAETERQIGVRDQELETLEARYQHDIERVRELTSR